MDVQNCFSVVYTFKIKEGKESEFIQNWKDLTILFYEYEGSLGSRLHKVEENFFMAYALWPNKKTFDEASNKLPSEVNELKFKQQQCIDEFKIVHQSFVVSDLIQSEIHPNNVEV